MDIDLVAVLSEEQHLPREALRRAARHPEAVAEPVLAALARAADDPDGLSDAEANLLFWGLHALAAARDVRVFPDLLRLLRYDDETLDGLFGDVVTETLPRVLASTFDGDTEAFGRFLLDSTLDPFVHGSAFAALAFLAREGRIEREAARTLIVRFDDARVAVDENAWAGWEEAIAYLGLTDLAPRAEAARRDGRLTDEISDAGWFRRALRQVTAEPPRYDAFYEDRYGTLDDPVTALAWTAAEAGQPIVNPFKHVGRNDPCPCGSGKKFKKCCLDAKAPPPLLPGLH